MLSQLTFSGMEFTFRAVLAAQNVNAMRESAKFLKVWRVCICFLWEKCIHLYEYFANCVGLLVVFEHFKLRSREPLLDHYGAIYSCSSDKCLSHLSSLPKSASAAVYFSTNIPSQDRPYIAQRLTLIFESSHHLHRAYAFVGIFQ